MLRRGMNDNGDGVGDVDADRDEAKMIKDIYTKR